MFDPAMLGAQMQPGDKISMTFHKAKADREGSFMDNVNKSGLTQPAPAPTAMAPMGGMAPLQPSHSMLIAAMRNRFAR